MIPIPNEEMASSVVEAMTSEKTLSSMRMTTGDQYFVFAVKTINSEYVIRMTAANHKNKFNSAIYWQNKLLPLGIPLAKFIKTDLDGVYSQFPALLMQRLPGNDLINVYSSLTDLDKRSLAQEIVKIQNATAILPEGLSYGIIDNYDHISEDKSWYDFLINRLQLFKDLITNAAIFDANQISKVISIAKNMEEDLRAIRSIPFLWDASERNVIVYNGKISGIVDVDDMCFGDPLFVLGLTYSALENEGYDTVYPDYWMRALNLDQKAKLRLEFYRLFYVVVFMRKHATTTTNCQKVIFNVQRLENILQWSLLKIKELI
jgi:hypothetical protein